MNLSTAIDSWLAYRKQLVALGVKRESTHANQVKVAAQLIAGLGDHELADLRKSHIELYAGARLQHCKPVTVSAELDVLRQILAWCVDEKLMAAEDRPRFPTVTVANEEAPLPSEEAFAWILARLPHHQAQALELMMLTGLSPHELERLQTRDMGPKPGTIVVAGYEFDPGLLIGMRPDFPVKQPSRRRWIPLNGRALLIWNEATMGTTPNFQPFPTVAGMQKAIKRAVRAGIDQLNDQPPDGAEHVTPKTMRKWFASTLAAATGDDQVPEHVLQRLLGHAPGSPITRKHYVRSTDEQISGAVVWLKAKQ